MYKYKINTNHRNSPHSTKNDESQANLPVFISSFHDSPELWLIDFLRL